MSPEGKPQSSPLGFSPIREGLPLSRRDLDNSDEPEEGNRACTSVQARAESGPENFSSGKSPFLKVLIDAEAASSAAAIQLVAFKDAVDNEFASSGRSTKDKSQITRQKVLLLEKLEEFRRLNKSVRQKLKQFQDAEVYRIDADRKMETLLKWIRNAESENENLKKDLDETEKRIGKLMDLRREEQENIKSLVHTTKSIDTTRAHLQGQLRNKEAENNRLTVHLRSLERTVAEQRSEIDQLKTSFASLTKKAVKDKESLRKAAQAQKLRAERFEAAIEKCTAQLKEKDSQLAKARSERDSRRRRKEQVTDEKEKLAAQIDLMKSELAELTLRLQKERDELTAANERMAQSLDKLIADNEDLTITNAILKSSVAQLEEQLADCESALVEEKTISLEKKHEAEQCHFQVAELKAEIDSLQIKYANLLRETRTTQDVKETAVEKVRQELQGRIEELRVYPELLGEAEQSLLQCQENLRRLERQCSEKSESVKELQFKMETQSKQLRSSLEMKESVHEATLKLQEKVNSLQRKIDQVQQENLELVRKLAAQDEALGYSNRQLDQRSSECQALNRQLEAALSDVREQVSKVKSQTSSREEALQTKILQLQAEQSRRNNELKLLRESKQNAEKQFEVRLKNLQLSLDQSETHKRSIQNYVDFLKKSYMTIFDEGLQTSAFGSSYFLK
ncbi:outer dense fiber protein 2-like isoform X1 [Poecilia latipinna]|uniref:Outer dense fiber protein 2-like n=1 Tax=Poecilia latipinna TaxID=48699 RepID=A0A3B3UJU8_9TELE|nr:PREDICTED: outer dense fiber protein 2-like isoform X1 [Poecilia latipinna]XP_014906537.1 PREDICTED: outer dense fiber protein 2-like isoform X1 [Poecilia latipinna]